LEQEVLRIPPGKGRTTQTVEEEDFSLDSWGIREPQSIVKANVPLLPERTIGKRGKNLFCMTQGNSQSYETYKAERNDEIPTAHIP